MACIIDEVSITSEILKNNKLNKDNVMNILSIVKTNMENMIKGFKEHGRGNIETKVKGTEYLLAMIVNDMELLKTVPDAISDEAIFKNLLGLTNQVLESYEGIIKATVKDIIRTHKRVEDGLLGSSANEKMAKDAIAKTLHDNTIKEMMPFDISDINGFDYGQNELNAIKARYPKGKE